MKKLPAFCLAFILLGVVCPNLCHAGPPDPWTGQDVGLVRHQGAVEFTDKVFKLNGSGAEVWEINDSFFFVSQPLTGNGTIIAHFKEGLKFVDPFAKAGVMIRASLAPNSANAFLAVTSMNGATFQQRPTAGSDTTGITLEGNFSSAVDGPGLWLKLERSGKKLTASTSADGIDWKKLGVSEIDLPEEALIGLAMTTHDANQEFGFASFDSVEVIPAVAKK